MKSKGKSSKDLKERKVDLQAKLIYQIIPIKLKMNDGAILRVSLQCVMFMSKQICG